MTKKIVDLLQDEKLRGTLDSIMIKVQKGFESGNVGDTLLGFQHFETVDKNLATLVVELKNVAQMSDTELFLLGASAYLHDLLKSSSAWGPLTHGGKVMQAVSDRPELYGLGDRAEAIPVGFISAAHSSRSLDDTDWGRVPEDLAKSSGEVIDLRKLAAIFLLADTLLIQPREEHRRY